MNILLIGSGGREHALAWKITQSLLCQTLHIAPGNGGTQALGVHPALDVEDHQAVIAYCREHGIGLVVVGPEAPLVAGLADRLTEAGIKTFGPSAKAAEIEGSKGFMKDICAECGVPTAAYRRFTDKEEAKAYIRERSAPIVVKADGLAAGKGVTVAEELAEALAAVEAAMGAGIFGESGWEVVVEDLLQGEEASFFALVDGTNVLPLAASQDHKRVGEGDQGANTGGMGAYSPAPVVTPEVEARIMERVIHPLVRGMAAAGRPYKGLLYAGLMISPEGEPSVIEFNCRFGDPECQPVLMRLKSDLLPALIATADGMLKSFDLRWHDQAALSVVMASKGYPKGYEKGSVIKGLAEAEAADQRVKIFHAGTKSSADGDILSDGGRVLNVTAMAPSIAEAQAAAYAAVDRVDWPGGFCRRDIGWRALARE